MIAAYIRTSTSKQDKGAETQEREITKYHDINEDYIYRDLGVSGVKSIKPEMEALKSQIRSSDNVITKVVVYSYSRIARSTEELLAFLRFLKEYKVTLVSIAEGLDTSTPIGKMTYTILGSVATFEREMTVERVTAGMANAKAKGRIPGPKSKFSHKKAKELYTFGYSYSKVADKLGCSKSQARHLIKKGA